MSCDGARKRPDLTSTIRLPNSALMFDFPSWGQRALRMNTTVSNDTFTLPDVTGE